MKDETYKLIPMSEITDEAREITVAWMECEDKHWIGQKHKLASDIMNYAIKYHKSQPIEPLPAPVTDEMIEEWAWNVEHLMGDDGLTTNEIAERRIGRDEGAKAMRDGKIK